MTSITYKRHLKDVAKTDDIKLVIRYRYLAKSTLKNEKEQGVETKRYRLLLVDRIVEELKNRNKKNKHEMKNEEKEIWNLSATLFFLAIWRISVMRWIPKKIVLYKKKTSSIFSPCCSLSEQV